MSPPEKPIVLVGMMGAGKTTIGRKLALALGRDFYDLDTEIEKLAGKSIRQIFQDQGEDGFRGLEKSALDDLLGHQNAVIAAGGGTPPSDLAVNIWLRGDLETLFKRVKGDRSRPKVSGFEAFKTLYGERHPAYSRAEIHVDIAGDDRHKTLEQILEALKKLDQ